MLSVNLLHFASVKIVLHAATRPTVVNTKLDPPPHLKYTVHL